jgi:type II secretion system-associated lipoprotein
MDWMYKRAAIFTLIVFVSVLSNACASAPVNKETLLKWNTDLNSRTFIAKTDIRPDFLTKDSSSSKIPLLFKKGDEISIWMESGNDWLRVKAYKAKDNREQAAGRVILYLFYKEILDANKDKNIKDPVFFQSELKLRLDEIITAKDSNPVIKDSP